MIPWRVRKRLRPWIFSAGIFRFRHSSHPERAFPWLYEGWGNIGFSADVSYLEAVYRFASTTNGQILECGSGLTTILLGIVAPGRVTTLEHTPIWKKRVEEIAHRFDIPVNILQAPLKDYGKFHWYSLPPEIQHSFELVVCDGPPSNTPGGRYGLLPAVNQHLAPNVKILMDDAERREEEEIIARWGNEFGTESEDHFTHNGRYAVVTRSVPASI